jgi:hypothetical protein
MDVPVIGMNKMAFDELQSVKEMKIVPGATHLFEEKATESRKPYLVQRHLVIKEMSS